MGARSSARMGTKPGKTPCFLLLRAMCDALAFIFHHTRSVAVLYHIFRIWVSLLESPVPHIEKTIYIYLHRILTGFLPRILTGIFAILSFSGLLYPRARYLHPTQAHRSVSMLVPGLWTVFGDLPPLCPGYSTWHWKQNEHVPDGGWIKSCKVPRFTGITTVMFQFTRVLTCTNIFWHYEENEEHGAVDDDMWIHLMFWWTWSWF